MKLESSMRLGTGMIGRISRFHHNFTRNVGYDAGAMVMRTPLHLRQLVVGRPGTCTFGASKTVPQKRAGRLRIDPLIFPIDRGGDPRRDLWDDLAKSMMRISEHCLPGRSGRRDGGPSRKTPSREDSVRTRPTNEELMIARHTQPTLAVSPTRT
jgi:hypothetical protein